MRAWFSLATRLSHPSFQCASVHNVLEEVKKNVSKVFSGHGTILGIQACICRTKSIATSRFPSTPHFPAPENLHILTDQSRCCNSLDNVSLDRIIQLQQSTPTIDPANVSTMPSTQTILTSFQSWRYHPDSWSVLEQLQERQQVWQPLLWLLYRRRENHHRRLGLESRRQGWCLVEWRR